MQSLIDKWKVITYILANDSDHKAFKDPIPKYEKGETSNNKNKSHDAKINYTQANTNNVINVIEPINGSVYMMGPKFDEKPNYDNNDEWPMVVLRMHNSF